MWCTATLLSPPLILSRCKSQTALPKPPGLPWIHHSRAELGCLTLSAAGRSPGRVCISEEHPETQAPCRTRLRSSDRPAQGGERSLSWYLVALLDIRPSNIARRESAKAGEPKPGKVIVSSLSFSHLLPPEGQAGSWRGHAAPSLGILCTACTRPRFSLSGCFPCPKPASQQQLGRGG